MGVPPNVLLLDDGELDDVQEMLQEMGVAFARVRGGAIVPGSPPPRDLLISTPRRIGAVRESIADAVSPPIRVMVVNEDSNALRSQLRRSGFDYLVRRPVHTEALRLMLLHCMYKGEERRQEPRVAVGFEVSFRAGLMTRRATLADLSIRGCRLLSRYRVDRGRRIRVQIPEALEAGEPIQVPGRVMRLEGEKGDSDECFELGISFESLDDETRQALELIIEDRAQGPATLRSGAGDVPRPTPESAPQLGPSRREALLRGPTRRASADGSPSSVGTAGNPQPPKAGTADRPVERRRGRRAPYTQTIPAFGNRALRVLVGRDLSVGGMRIQPHSELALGDRLHLAIYGEAGEEPLLVWGRVDRNDDEGGSVIVFDPVDGAIAARLERIVSGLPAVESLHHSEAESLGTVVSEILE